MHLYKNGSLMTGSTISRKVTTGGDIGAASIIGVVSLATTDYVELWLETDDGDTLTLENACMIVRVLG